MAEDVRPDASDVGVPCFICATIDFLPLKCQHCQRAFCKTHANEARPGAHGCESHASTIVTQEQQGRSGDNTFESLLPDRTRKPVEATPEELAKLDKKKAALALLQKNFPQTASGRAGGSGNESSASKREQPVKAPSRTIVGLKLKQNAKPLDPSRSQMQVLSNDRRYFFGNIASGLNKKPLWLPKSCSCGKALDLLATEYNLVNRNNLSATAPPDRLILMIDNSEDKARAIEMGKSIGDALADGDEVRVGKASEFGG